MEHTDIDTEVAITGRRDILVAKLGDSANLVHELDAVFDERKEHFKTRITFHAFIIA